MGLAWPKSFSFCKKAAVFSGVPDQEPLYLFKGFPVNDCLMGIFYDIPLVLRDNFLNV